MCRCVYVLIYLHVLIMLKSKFLQVCAVAEGPPRAPDSDVRVSHGRVRLARRHASGHDSFKGTAAVIVKDTGGVSISGTGVVLVGVVLIIVV